MPLEQEVLWALKLTGEDRLQALRAVMKDTEKSFLANSQAAKEFEKSLKAQLTAADLVGEKSKGMVADLIAFKNTSHDVMLGTTSDTGRMKDSYFSLGTEMRAQLKGMRFEHRLAHESVAALSLALGDTLGGQLQSVAGSFLSMNFAAKSMSNVMQASSIPAVASFGAAMGAAVLPIVLVAAGIIQLISWNDKLNESLVASRKTIEGLKFALGEESAAAHRAALQKMVDDAQQRSAEASHLNFAERSEENLPLGVGGVFKKSHEDAKLKAIAEFKQAEKDLADFEKTWGDEKKKAADDQQKAADKLTKTLIDGLSQITAKEPIYISEEQKKRFETGIQFSDHLRQLMLMPKAERQALQLENIQAGLIDSTSGATAAKYLKNRSGTGQPESISKTMNEEFKAADAAKDSFAVGWSHMTMEMSHQLGNTVGKAFADLFGGAKTLLGDFAADVASTFTQLAASAAVRGLFSLLSTIPGLGFLSFIAGGASGSGSSGSSGSSGGKTHSFNPGAGPGADTAVAVQSLSSALASGQWKVRGADIIFATDRARPMVNAGRMFIPAVQR